jgi:hypothetical protein
MLSENFTDQNGAYAFGAFLLSLIPIVIVGLFAPAAAELFFVIFVASVPIAFFLPAVRTALFSLQHRLTPEGVRNILSDAADIKLGT